MVDYCDLSDMNSTFSCLQMVDSIYHASLRLINRDVLISVLGRSDLLTSNLIRFRVPMRYFALSIGIYKTEMYF